MINLFMRKLFSLLIPALFALSLPLTGASAAGPGSPGDEFFDSSLGDYAEELDLARQDGKLGVLLVFEADTCPYCHIMREQALSKAAAQELFRKHFSIYRVDILGSVAITDFAGREMTEKAFAKQWRVHGTPTYLFIGLDGAEMARFTGVTRNLDAFLALGRFVIGGHWRDQDFDAYHPDNRAPPGLLRKGKAG